VSEPLRERAQQELVVASLRQRLLEAPGLFAVVSAGLQRRVEQILGALGLPELAGDAIQLEQDRALAEVGAGLVFAGPRAPEQQQERAVGAFGVLELALLARDVAEQLQHL